jgi:hypothetical protein
MGWYFSQIGNYSIEVHDSSVYDIEKSKSKEFYENYKVDVNFLKGNKFEKIELPLSLFGKIVKLRKYYNFEFDIKNLHTILYNELVKRDIKIIGYGEIQVHLGDQKWKSYYLNSIPCDTPIKLDDSFKPIFLIKSYKELTWFKENGISFVQTSFEIKS